MTAALITGSATLIAGIIAAAIALYIKRIDRQNKQEAANSEIRSTAFNKMLAAGDVAWLTRSQIAEERPKIVVHERDRVAEAARRLFQNGLDEIKSSAQDYDAEAPLLVQWFYASFEGVAVGPTQFENAREQVVNRQRQERGLKRRLKENEELPLFEKLRSGRPPKELPDGLFNYVVFEEPGSFLIQGSGEEFFNLMMESAHHAEATENSRRTALHRVEEWERKGVWKWPDGSNPDVDPETRSSSDD